MTFDIRAQLLDTLMRRSFVPAADPSNPESRSSVVGILTTLSAEGINAAAACLLDAVRDYTPDFVAGMKLGSYPLATAVSLAGYRAGENIDALYVRPGKDAPVIEGPLNQGARIAIVDDATASADGILEAAELLVSRHEASVVRVVTLIDLEQGAAEALRNAGHEFHAIYTLSKLEDTFRRTGTKPIAAQGFVHPED